MNARRYIPDRREFLSDAGKRLAIAEHFAGVASSRLRGSFLRLGFAFLAQAILTAAIFWAANL